MAGSLRPVVLLMALASLLFVADGIFDGAFPGGESWIGGPAHYGLGFLSYVFALVNAAIAVAIARGSERTLVVRMFLSAFFVIERPLSAFALGPKRPEAVAVHFVTLLVELVIFVGAYRVWRLGHGVEGIDTGAAFDLDAPSVVATDEADDAPPAPLIPARRSRTIGVLALVLATVLVADGIVAGFVPGARQWGIVGDASGWLVYLFAAVVLTVALRAVHGGSLALRVLMILALILFFERAFSPFALSSFDPTALALHVLAAFLALALALACAGAMRGAANGAALRSSTSRA